MLVENRDLEDDDRQDISMDIRIEFNISTYRLWNWLIKLIRILSVLCSKVCCGGALEFCWY